MAAKYHPEAYSLLNNNCNNFSADLSQLLTGNSIPVREHTQQSSHTCGHQEHITNLPDVVRASPLGPLLVGFLDSMEQRMKTFAQQGHTFRPDVQHVEAYPTPDSYAGAMQGDTPPVPPPVLAAGDANTASTPTCNPTTAKEEFERRLRAEFDKLMAAGGMTPNQAAAQALRNVRSARN